MIPASHLNSYGACEGLRLNNFTEVATSDVKRSGWSDAHYVMTHARSVVTAADIYVLRFNSLFNAEINNFSTTKKIKLGSKLIRNIFTDKLFSEDINKATFRSRRSVKTDYLCLMLVFTLHFEDFWCNGWIII